MIRITLPFAYIWGSKRAQLLFTILLWFHRPSISHTLCHNDFSFHYSIILTTLLTTFIFILLYLFLSLDNFPGKYII